MVFVSHTGIFPLYTAPADPETASGSQSALAHAVVPWSDDSQSQLQRSTGMVWLGTRTPKSTDLVVILPLEQGDAIHKMLTQSSTYPGVRSISVRNVQMHCP